MNSIIHKIKEYIPNESITFRRDPVTNNIELVLNRIKAIITILEDNTWDEIKRHIDAKLNSDEYISCSICSEDMKHKKVSCPHCANYWCIPCYINIFRANRGLIKCPYCRFEYGYKQSDEMVEAGILDIISKSGI